MAIVLSAEEKGLFRVLLAAVETCDMRTELRVAGGWVRDKLLGLKSEDLDVALDNMTGTQFCAAIVEHLRQIGVVAKDKEYKPIARNPDRSKHLETAKLNILGQSIDFVNLRAETYSSDTRIPQMTFGTPTEDAYRRDLTINSMFYNIATQQLEDFTGQGLSDLKNGIIRTPLIPLETFLDDPLRVLRSVRFAARFDFKLDPELAITASSPAVRHALATKVSKERVANEVTSMLFGKRPNKAMHLLHELGYFEDVFKPPVIFENWETSCMKYLQGILGMLDELNQDLSEEERRLILLGSFLFPFKDLVYGKGKDMQPVSNAVIVESLSMKKKTMAPAVERLHKTVGDPCFQEWYDLHKSSLEKGESAPFEGVTRVKAGLLLKDLHNVRAFAMLFSLMEAPPHKRLEVCKAVKDSVLESGLTNMKHLLNGNDIKAELNLVDGPVIKEWGHRILLWQLENPTGSDKECREWLRAQASIQPHQNKKPRQEDWIVSGDVKNVKRYLKAKRE